MQRPIALDSERLWIDAVNVVAILPISEEKRLSQRWDSRFTTQVVAVGSEGGLDTRPVRELVKVFRDAGVQLGYIKDTDEAVRHEALSSLRVFKGDPEAPVQYFHSVAKLTNGRESRELWFAATPKQVLDSRTGISPAPI
jgi:hypothetical protein